MNGPEHYREAEQDIERANNTIVGPDGKYFLARAQVHATLALTAAVNVTAAEVWDEGYAAGQVNDVSAENPYRSESPS